MGHQGSISKKIKAIESIDHEIVQVIVEQMQQAKEEYRMLILPDHPTTYEWQKSDSVDGEFSSISGAVTPYYTPTKEDIGQFLD